MPGPTALLLLLLPLLAPPSRHPFFKPGTTEMQQHLRPSSHPGTCMLSR